jgi:hypothetical protein
MDCPRVCDIPDPDGTGRLRECPPARALARFLLLYFAQTASPILVLRRGAMLARDRSSTHAVPGRGRRCPVGATLRGGWKNRLGAGARSASVSCSPCMAERSGPRARSELHGAGPEPIFPAESEWSSFSCERRPSCMSPYRAPPGATPRTTNRSKSLHPNPLPAGEGEGADRASPQAIPAASTCRESSARTPLPSGGSATHSSSRASSRRRP